ncbi:carbon monoxide oxidation accessory protein CoxE [Halarchaeum acidiphilum MH1-52-1]|uniref:Carbon monoxide oxidation accessory protein CoxE n=1 Tax=Halarchaeum acidiphilum MH1-52-1 TaxID=1261545 RepID=U3A5X5_9EURY|nr:VWA domain-containing protein [Halarchaeum acidiphilum]GAD53064.1 carbon monoxide oxidation accessory protein CoxE [Halarchaeum acidiphilum MH1-52-1]
MDDHLRRELVRFAAALREGGVAVPGDGALAAADALAALDDRGREGVRAALRATLCTRPADEGAFDSRFETFWARVRGGDATYGGDDGIPTLDTGAEGAADAPGQMIVDEAAAAPGGASGERAGGVGPSESERAGSQYSADGASEPVSLGGVRGDDAIDDAVATFTEAVASLPGRRWEGGDDTPDVRRALRRGVATGGVPLPLPERERERTAARGIVFVDVSGSVLDRLDRDALLGFCHAVRKRWRRTPIYFFDTALRDVSGAFDVPAPAAAAEVLEATRVEWGGGTRIGDALAALHREHPERVGRRDTVVVVSDGIERGGTDVLREQAAWLSRRAGRVLWLNPLAADERWTPSAPGMRAVLPFVDGLYAFADAADLADAADDLALRGPTLRAVEGAEA